jgi:hypothetical protein
VILPAVFTIGSRKADSPPKLVLRGIVIIRKQVTARKPLERTVGDYGLRG